MISLSHLNKLIFFIIFITILNFNSSFAEDEPADIWDNKKETENNVEEDILD